MKGGGRVGVVAPLPKIFVMRGPIDLRFVMNVNYTSNFHLRLITWQFSCYHGYQGLYGRHFVKIFDFLILSKIEEYYRKWIENTVLCDKNVKYWE